MVTYSNPVNKTWLLDDAAGFKNGSFNGTEFENPNFADKIVLACDVGGNILLNPDPDWNPSFERKDLLENRPEFWVLDFVWGSAGSEYIQNAPDAYDGTAYVRLKNENLHKGLLGLQPGQSPYAVNLIIDQAKFYTVRYHGRYHNPQHAKPQPCSADVIYYSPIRDLAFYFRVVRYYYQR